MIIWDNWSIGSTVKGEHILDGMAVAVGYGVGTIEGVGIKVTVGKAVTVGGSWVDAQADRAKENNTKTRVGLFNIKFNWGLVRDAHIRIKNASMQGKMPYFFSTTHV